MTAPGAGANMLVEVVVDGLKSSVPTTKYAPPSVTTLSTPPAAGYSTRGGEVVVVTGANFGAARPGRVFFEHVSFANGVYTMPYPSVCEITVRAVMS